MAQGVKEGEAEAREDDGPGAVAETEAEKEGEEVNLRTLPMTREEFWRQYWDRIDAGGEILADLPTPHRDRCWIWTGTTNANGYGVVRIQGRSWMLHRLAHHVFNGELEPELDVLHSCDTPPCCNPLHLRQGTVQENWDDRIESGEMVEDTTDYMRGPRAQRARETQQITPMGW